MEDVANRFSDLALNEIVRFRDLWETKTRAGLLTIEEGVLSQWHAGRIVLVGDSAHKVSPSCDHSCLNQAATVLSFEDLARPFS